MMCEYCNKREAVCWVRTFKVCRECFKIFKEDNVRRHSKGLDIPKVLITLEEDNKFKKILKGGNKK